MKAFSRASTPELALRAMKLKVSDRVNVRQRRASRNIPAVCVAEVSVADVALPERVGLVVGDKLHPEIAESISAERVEREDRMLVRSGSDTQSRRGCVNGFRKALIKSSFFRTSYAGRLDGFVASAPRNDGVRFFAILSPSLRAQAKQSSATLEDSLFYPSGGPKVGAELAMTG